MSGPLLTTKLFVPAPRANLVPRPRLLQRLDEGLRAGHRLTLISAPAGFGKTTLLSDWIRRRESPVAWLSIDDQDNEPARFWTYLVAALQVVHAGFGQDTQLLLQAPQPPAAESVLYPLLNELAALARTPLRADIVLVLDDYHLISTPQLHEGIAFLLEHQPDNLHLVISTRADPPVPLFRLRARGQLTELRSADLRFTPDEAAHFLNAAMDLGLQPAEVEALEARTEGWIVGLQLAALSLRGRTDAPSFIRGFSGSHHYILEYLTQEVLARQTEPVRRFLLWTSILERLCGPLCDAVMGLDETARQADADDATKPASSRPFAGLRAQDMLSELDQANLFLVPLDDQRLWYRYHHLFGDLLRKRLQQGADPGQVARLQQRASQWHEAHGSLDEAVLYASQAGDYERVLRMVEEAALAGRLQSRLTTMLRWLEDVPAQALALRPQLRIYQAWALVINEQLESARQVLRESAAALQSVPASPETDAARDSIDTLVATVEMMATALATAYGGEKLENAFQATLVVREKALAGNNVFLAGHATNGLAMARFHQGRLGEAAEYYRQLLDLGTQGDASRLPLAAVGHVGLASICLERNELDAAARHLDEGLRLGQHRVGANTLASAAITQSRLRQAAGDSGGASAALDRAEQHGPVRGSGPAMHRLARQRAWLRLSAGDLDGAAHLIQGLSRLLDEEEFGGEQASPFHEAEQILLARVQLLRGEAGGAFEVLDRIDEDARAAGRLARVAEILLLKALAQQALGDVAAGADFLRESLALVEPERYVRVYLDEGARLVPLLSALGHGPQLPGSLQRFARELVSALEADAGDESLVSEDRPPVLVEALTDRERQVLRLMAAGLSSPEIADELVIAISTARSHIKNIYGKLDAHSRHEALERAEQLQLL